MGWTFNLAQSWWHNLIFSLYLLYILVLQRDVIYQKPATFFRKKSRDLNASKAMVYFFWSFACVLLSNIYKSVWRKLISFCFSLFHFTSSKNQTKKIFQDVGTRSFLGTSWSKKDKKSEPVFYHFWENYVDKISEKNIKSSCVGAPSNFHIKQKKYLVFGKQNVFV